MRLILAGGGKMGEAFLAGLLRSGTLAPEEALVVEVDSERRAYLDRTFAGIETLSDLPQREVCSRFDVFLAAVKPADLPQLLERVRERVPPSVMILSIAAGVRISSLRRSLGAQYEIVRAMPNLGATVGAGVSAYAADDDVTDEKKALARQVLEAVGPAMEVPERKLDAVTALSGSGPAYVFLLAEAMESAGKKLGLSGEETSVLVPHTILGAGLLLVERDAMAPGGKSAKEWREAVTSKGGTTEAALEVLRRRHFIESLEEAIAAAAERAADLDALSSSAPEP